MCSARQGISGWAGAIDCLPVPAYALDVEGRVIAWNEPLSRLVGVRRDEMVGRAGGVHAVAFIGKEGLMLADLVLAPVLPAPDHLIGVDRDGSTTAALLSAPALGPARQLRVLASPIMADDQCVGAIEVVLCSDPREVRILGSHAIFDQLMSTVRHDVLNQLTIVLGYIELARDGINDPVANADLDRAVAAAESIRHHVALTREFRGIGIRGPIESPLAELVAAATEQAEIVGIQIEIQLPEIGVRVDPLFIRALEHLVQISTTVEPPATLIHIEAVNSGPLVLWYGDDSVDGRWEVQANGLPREMAPCFPLVQAVLALDGISLSCTGDSNRSVAIRLPGLVLTQLKKEE